MSGFPRIIGALVAIGSLAGMVLVGACNVPKPYYAIDNWYIRNNARPQYFAKYDVFYYHPEYHHAGRMNITNHDFAVKQTTDLFGKKVRVFAPLCHDLKDAQDAFDWYIDNYHDPEQPFVMLGEGEGGKMLLELLEDISNENSFVSAHYITNVTDDGFMDATIVSNIEDEVNFFLYEREWGRENGKRKPWWKKIW